jgi:hypothetical protein
MRLPALSSTTWITPRFCTRSKDHFKQQGYEEGQLIHFVKVDGRALKVVTAPHHQYADSIAIITIVPLDIGGA